MLFLHILLPCFAFSQDYSHLEFECLNNTDGLISDVVYTTRQDNTGFIWFGTEEGIVRYDGYEMNSFKDHPHLGKLYGTTVDGITFDQHSNIYICSREGFFAFSEDMEPILSYVSKEVGNIRTNCCLIGSDGNIYISSDNGFFVVNTIDKSVKRLHPNHIKGMESPVTNTIQEDLQGNIWVGSWGGGVLKLNSDKASFTAFKLFKSTQENIPSNVVSTIKVDNRGYLWVGVWEQGLYVLDITGEKVTILKKITDKIENSSSLNLKWIFGIEADQQNSIWVATPLGLGLFTNTLTSKHKAIHFDMQTNGLSSNLILSVFHDKSGLFWITTKGGGVNKLNLDKNKFAHKKISALDNKSNSETVYSFATDYKGRLLIGVEGRGFVVVSGDKYNHYSDIKEYSTINLNTAMSFLVKKNGDMWIGTRYYGAIKFDVSTRKMSYFDKNTTPNFIGREVGILYEFGNKNIIVGTEDGINYIEKKDNYYQVRSKFFFDEKGNDVISKMTGIVEVEEGHFLVSSATVGMFELVINDDKILLKRILQAAIPQKITTLHKDNRGVIWIGTRGKGLIRMKDTNAVIDTLFFDYSKHGEIVYDIIQDNHYNYWVATNIGLTKIWFEDSVPNFEHFTHEDGLQGNIFTPHSFYKDKEGILYVGGYNGYNVFDPKEAKGDKFQGNTVLTDLTIDGSALPFFTEKYKNITLKHNQNNVSFGFATLNYNSPIVNKYAYIMEGLDSKWKYVPSNMRNVTYRNLPHGSYVFRAKGSNAQGVWGDKELIINVIVKNAPYKTWWAVLLYIIFFTIIVLLIFWQRTKHLRIKQALQLEHVEREKADNLLSYKQSFFMNVSHELLTPLSTLSLTVEEAQKSSRLTVEGIKLMRRNIDRLMQMLKQLLLFRKLESGTVALNLEQTNISDFIYKSVKDFYMISEKKSVDFDINIEKDIQGILDKEKTETIISNLLSNAFRYTHKGGCVSFELKHLEDEGQIQIEVSDTGGGIKEETIPHIFERFYRGKDSGDTIVAGVGIGLNLTKGYVDILNGKIEVESVINEGSVFTVSFPISENSYKNTKIIPPLAQSNDIPNVIIEGNKQQDTIDFVSNVVKKRHTLLIVEDNNDFRTALSERLRATYALVTASDGQEALDLIISKDFDLIISDIMMPKISGIDLCQRIKADINLSHIPIILLTAKIGDDNQIKGYEAGADGYVEKPINFKLLTTRISNLLAQRHQLKQTYKSKLDFNMGKEAISSLDEVFLLKAKDIVVKNIDNSKLSVLMLVQELNITNSTLYRKMKHLIGMSPKEFISHIRINAATAMLHEESNISNIAYRCGFSNSSHFAACFKKEYGVTPKEYASGKRKIR